MVIQMNSKIRIIFCVCLTVAICFAVASAATQNIKKNSINRPDASKITTIIYTPTAPESIKTGSNLYWNQVSFSPGNFKKPDFSSVSLDLIKPAITPPPFFSARITSINNNEYITEEEAIEIALSRFPGIELTEPIKASIKRITAPGYPLAINPCWVIEVQGRDPKYSSEIHWAYGGEVIIDAVTGEILYVNVLC